MTSDCAYCSHQFNKPGKPFPVECTLTESRGKPCLVCERQISLCAQIEETKKLLDQLVIDEREARTDRNNCHDPLHLLPTEIISHIFLSTLPEFSLQKQLRSAKDFPNKASCLPSALALGSVCRTWREIAWSTPRLWTDIMLTLVRPPTWDQMDAVEKWLHLSKPFPLNIRLVLMDQSEDTEEEIEETYPEFITLFNKHSARWSTLSVQSSSSVSQRFVVAQNGAPLLTTLQLLNFDRNNNGYYFNWKGGKLSPAYVDVAGYYRLNKLFISWSNVTHATLDEISLDHYVQLLQSAPKLVNLQLRCVQLNHHYVNPAARPIQLQLKNFLVSADLKNLSNLLVTSLYSVIFDSVTCPLLEDLSIDSSKSSLHSVNDFLQRSSPPLKSLYLKTRCAEQEALDLLSHLPPCLKNIQLNVQLETGNDFNLSGLFNLFSSSPSLNIRPTMPSRPQLFPSLERFEYYVNRTNPCPIPWDRLLDLLHPFSGDQRPLKKLTFHPRGTDSWNYNPRSLIDKKYAGITESAIRGLIRLLDDDVDVYLPSKISREDLLVLLEE